jgi:hypothetical protein
MKFILALLLTIGGSGHGVWAQTLRAPSPGEVLYSTHCISCHGREMHWRDKKLATDWQTLKVQVDRWQRNMRLAWSDDEIEAVTRYLNDVHYFYPGPLVSRADAMVVKPKP